MRARRPHSPLLSVFSVSAFQFYPSAPLGDLGVLAVDSWEHRTSNAQHRTSKERNRSSPRSSWRPWRLGGKFFFLFSRRWRQVGGLTQSRPTAFRPAGTSRIAPVQTAYKPSAVLSRIRPTGRCGRDAHAPLSFQFSVFSFQRFSVSAFQFYPSAPLGDLCVLAVNSSPHAAGDKWADRAGSALPF
jgi:hypothetical protein